MNADLPQKIRTFVAIYPNAETLERIVAAQKQLRGEFSSHEIRWTAPEQIHLTLQFLGGIESARVGEFEKAVENGSRGFRPFALHAHGIGCFPNARQPKIIWAGLTGDSEDLPRLKTSLDKTLQQIGYIPEERPFHPHLTLGRVKELHGEQRRRMAELLAAKAEAAFGTWKVHEVRLMRSVLAPSGSAYELLHAAQLGTAA